MGSNALYLAQNCPNQRGIGLPGSGLTRNHIIIIVVKLQQHKNNNIGNIIKLYEVCIYTLFWILSYNTFKKCLQL
jgi:hypothetical protein